MTRKGLYHKPRKYGNHPVTVDGHTFPSKKEADRYCELKMLQRAGIISNLQIQVKYNLSKTTKVGNETLGRCDYIADFVYTKGEETIVEDTKGYRTKDYIVKRKWLYDKYGILIHEV